MWRTSFSCRNSQGQIDDLVKSNSNVNDETKKQSKDIFSKLTEINTNNGKISKELENLDDRIYDLENAPN